MVTLQTNRTTLSFRPPATPSRASIACVGVGARVRVEASESITEANEWLSKTFDDLASIISAELEQEALVDLLSREAVSTTVPTVGQVGVRRPNDA